MTAKKELAAKDQRIAELEGQFEQAQELAEVQSRNVTRLTKAVNAHRRVVIEHIRECQRFPDDERLQTLTVALITELDLAGLNVSAEVRVVPKAGRP